MSDPPGHRVVKLGMRSSSPRPDPAHLIVVRPANEVAYGTKYPAGWAACMASGNYKHPGDLDMLVSVLQAPA